MFGINPAMLTEAHMAGKLAFRPLSQNLKNLRLPGMLASGLIGAGIGGITGVARGDNYDSTATLRNFTSGALTGSAIGLAARFGLGAIPGAVGHLTGLRQAMRAESGMRFSAFKSAPIPRVLGTTGNIANKAGTAVWKAGGLLARNPEMTIAGAALAGGAALAYSSGNPSNDMSDMQSDGQDTRNDFHASTKNLVFGLNARRHR